MHAGHLAIWDTPNDISIDLPDGKRNKFTMATPYVVSRRSGGNDDDHGDSSFSLDGGSTNSNGSCNNLVDDDDQAAFEDSFADLARREKEVASIMSLLGAAQTSTAQKNQRLWHDDDSNASVSSRGLVKGLGDAEIFRPPQVSVSAMTVGSAASVQSNSSPSSSEVEPGHEDSDENASSDDNDDEESTDGSSASRSSSATGVSSFVEDESEEASDTLSGSAEEEDEDCTKTDDKNSIVLSIDQSSDCQDTLDFDGAFEQLAQREMEIAPIISLTEKTNKRQSWYDCSSVSSRNSAKSRRSAQNIQFDDIVDVGHVGDLIPHNEPSVSSVHFTSSDDDFTADLDPRHTELTYISPVADISKLSSNQVENEQLVNNACSRRVPTDTNVPNNRKRTEMLVDNSDINALSDENDESSFQERVKMLHSNSIEISVVDTSKLRRRTYSDGSSTVEMPSENAPVFKVPVTMNANSSIASSALTGDDDKDCSDNGDDCSFDSKVQDVKKKTAATALTVEQVSKRSAPRHSSQRNGDDVTNDREPSAVKKASKQMDENKQNHSRKTCNKPANDDSSGENDGNGFKLRALDKKKKSASRAVRKAYSEVCNGEGVTKTSEASSETDEDDLKTRILAKKEKRQARMLHKSATQPSRPKVSGSVDHENSNSPVEQENEKHHKTNDFAKKIRSVDERSSNVSISTTSCTTTSKSERKCRPEIENKSAERFEAADARNSKTLLKETEDSNKSSNVIGVPTKDKPSKTGNMEIRYSSNGDTLYSRITSVTEDSKDQLLKAVCHDRERQTRSAECHSQQQPERLKNGQRDSHACRPSKKPDDKNEQKGITAELRKTTKFENDAEDQQAETQMVAIRTGKNIKEEEKQRGPAEVVSLESEKTATAEAKARLDAECHAKEEQRRLEESTRLEAERIASNEKQKRLKEALLETKRVTAEEKQKCLEEASLEAERAAAEERKRSLAEDAHLEAKRVATEKAQARMESERQADDAQKARLEADRVAAEVEKEQMEEARLEAERAAAEEKKRSLAEDAHLEAKRVATEKAQARMETERQAEDEQKAHLEADRVAAEVEKKRMEEARLETELIAAKDKQASLEAERAAAKEKKRSLAEDAHLEAKGVATKEAQARMETECQAEDEQKARLEADRVAKEVEEKRMEEAQLEAGRIAADDKQKGLEVAHLEAESVATEEKKQRRLAKHARLEAERIATAEAEAQLELERQAKVKQRRIKEDASFEAERAAVEEEQKRLEKARMESEHVAAEDEKQRRLAEDTRLEVERIAAAEAEARLRVERKVAKEQRRLDEHKRLETDRDASKEEQERLEDARLEAELVAAEEEKQRRLAEDARMEAEKVVTAEAEARLEAERQDKERRIEKEPRLVAKQRVALEMGQKRLEKARLITKRATAGEEKQQRLAEDARLEAESAATAEAEEGQRRIMEEACFEAERGAAEAEKQRRLAEDARLEAERIVAAEADARLKVELRVAEEQDQNQLDAELVAAEQVKQRRLTEEARLKAEFASTSKAAPDLKKQQYSKEQHWIDEGDAIVGTHDEGGVNEDPIPDRYHTFENKEDELQLLADTAHLKSDPAFPSTCRGNSHQQTENCSIGKDEICCSAPHEPAHPDVETAVDREFRLALELAEVARLHPQLSPAEIKALVGMKNDQSYLVAEMVQKKVEKRAKERATAEMRWQSLKEGWKVALKERADRHYYYADFINKDPPFVKAREQLATSNRLLRAYRSQGHRFRKDYAQERRSLENESLQTKNALVKIQQSLANNPSGDQDDSQDRYVKALERSAKKKNITREVPTEEIELEAQMCRNMHRVVLLERQKTKVKQSLEQTEAFLQRCRSWFVETKEQKEAHLMTLDATQQSIRHLLQDTVRKQEALIAKLQASEEFRGVEGTRDDEDVPIQNMPADVVFAWNASGMPSDNIPKRHPMIRLVDAPVATAEWDRYFFSQDDFGKPAPWQQAEAFSVPQHMEGGGIGKDQMGGIDHENKIGVDIVSAATEYTQPKHENQKRKTKVCKSKSNKDKSKKKPTNAA